MRRKRLLPIPIHINLTLQRLHLFQSQNRMTHIQPLTMLLIRIRKKIPLRTDGTNQTHDDLLANGINGRVGHLCEQLFEVFVDLTGFFGKNRKGGIIAHASQGFFSADPHGKEEHFESFSGEPEGIEFAVGGRKVKRRRGNGLFLRPPFQIDHGFLDPFTVGMTGCHLLFDLIVGDNTLSFEIDQEHLSGFETVFDLHVLILQFGNDSDFRRQDDVIILRNVIPRRTKTIPIQRGTDIPPIRKGHHGRPIPRLHQTRIILVKRLLRIGQIVIVLPRLGNHHHDRFGQTPLGSLGHEFQNAVEITGIAHIVRSGRKELMGVVSKVIGGHESTAAEHPILISAKGVDLAVVAHHADGLGAFPGGEGVGGEAGVDERQVRDEGGVLDIEVVFRDLFGGELSFVGDGLGGEGVDVEAAFGSEHGGRFFFGHFADAE
mmetsp:Transcript_18556/g.38460  ORF Transcript_18556/g.38460 Transcript_18556/m.38460 type:complete len:432 (+) Transcript_18556:216-1511(+)